MADAADGDGFVHAVLAVLEEALVGEFVGDVAAGEAVAVANLLGLVPRRALDDAFDEEIGGGPGVRRRGDGSGDGSGSSGSGVRGGDDGGGRGGRVGRGRGEEQPGEQPRQRWQ